MGLGTSPLAGLNSRRASTFAYSAPHRDWFERDGTHVKSVGAAAYASYLFGSIPPEPTTTTAPPPP